MTVVIIVMWAAVIPAVVLAIRYLGGRSHPGDRGIGSLTIAQQVLAERFARGEIDEDEYRRRASLLREHHRL